MSFHQTLVKLSKIDMTQETAISEAVLKVIEDRATQIAWHWTLASATIFLL